MAYADIGVRQSATGTVSAEDGTVTITLPSAVASGSTLVLVGCAIDGVTSQACLLSSVADTSSNTWGTATNARSAPNLAPNAFGCTALNCAAGSPTVTATFNLSSSNKVSMALLEIENVPTTGVVDAAVTGIQAGTSSTSTSGTGTLDQTAELLVLCCGGWFGVPTNPSGWTSVLNQQNGSYIGCQISHKTVASTDSVVGTVDHESSPSTSAVMFALKAASTGAVQYKFQLNTSTFTSADTAITGFVWRNALPDSGQAQRFTGLAGDAVAGDLYITTDLPVDAALSDTIYGIFYNGTDTSGLISGAVVAV